MAYYQYERGAISEERLIAALGPLNEMKIMPPMREVWDRRRDTLAEGYRTYIDHLFADYDRELAARKNTPAGKNSE